MEDKGLIKGREIQSRCFEGMLLLITLADKPAPPCVGITVCAPDGMRSIIIPYPDWPQVIEAVESLRQELEIV